MTSKQKIGLWLAFIAVFIGVNTYLIYKEDSSVSRLNYVNEWVAVGQGDLHQTIQTTGMVIPTEQHHVYFSQDFGSFQSFLVEKGDKVEVGTPLFEYRVTDFEETRQYLQGEIAKLEGKIDSLEANIADLEIMKASVPTETTPVISDDNEDDILQRNNASTYTKYSIEMQISQKELQKDMLETELETYESQLQSLLTTPSNITVTSQHAGSVKDISAQLDNPVVTIVSADQTIQGTLTEHQTTLVKKGMKTFVTSDVLPKKVEGTIEAIQQLPTTDTTSDKTSRYPFTVHLNKKVDGMKAGYHVKMDIVTAAAKDVLVLPTAAVKQGKKEAHTWVLSEHGTVVKQTINTGLKVGRNVEITEGLERETLVAQNPKQIKKTGAPYVTPVQWEAISGSVIKKLNDNEVYEYLLLGVLE